MKTFINGMIEEQKQTDNRCEKKNHKFYFNKIKKNK